MMLSLVLGTRPCRLVTLRVPRSLHTTSTAFKKKKGPSIKRDGLPLPNHKLTHPRSSKPQSRRNDLRPTPPEHFENLPKVQVWQERGPTDTPKKLKVDESAPSMTVIEGFRERQKKRSELSSIDQKSSQSQAGQQRVAQDLLKDLLVNKNALLSDDFDDSHISKNPNQAPSSLTKEPSFSALQPPPKNLPIYSEPRTFSGIKPRPRSMKRDLPPHLLEQESSLSVSDADEMASSHYNKWTNAAEIQKMFDTDPYQEDSPDADTGNESSSSKIAPRPDLNVETTVISGKERYINSVKPMRDTPVATLKRGLSRVLFNPSVHFLRDPRSHVYNFTPSLETIPNIDEFAFNRLPAYVTASKDQELTDMAQQQGTPFYGSTSTLTKALSHIYFVISNYRGVNNKALSGAFQKERTDFTAGAKLPAMLWVKPRPGNTYAVDNDKRYDIDENILMHLGRVLEKMVTTTTPDMNRFLVSSPESAVPEPERKQREAYHYSRGEKLLMRSQLDCVDPRLPGNGTFDIKTRAAVVIRHDRANYKENSVYDVHKVTGTMESYEKEYYDMARSAFLKYSMQVRIGGMDGIFVAYHNTARIYGFQYISLDEMDRVMHGCSAMGRQAFEMSVRLLEALLERATQLFPKQKINLVIDSGHKDSDFFAFVTPETDLPPEKAPVVRLEMVVKSKLNGKVYTTPIDFETAAKLSGGGNVEDVEWTLEYGISETPQTEAGYELARRGVQFARAKSLAMASLSLPAGKTRDQMTALTRKPKTELEHEDGADGEEGDENEKIAVVEWKEPDDKTRELRLSAKKSGEHYEERTRHVQGKDKVIWTGDEQGFEST